MFSSDQYELLDFGNERKLERFGTMVVDRPSPAAAGTRPARPEAWSQAVVRYRRTSMNDDGSWKPAKHLKDSWSIRWREAVFLLRPTPFGHLGIFAEQAENWAWIDRQVRAAGRPLRILNLFAYTGGSTMAAALAGAEVVHVDAAKNVVAWARENAARSGLQDAPIRWIVEDASKFVQRELRRGNRYDAVILDPPSYGHGPTGQVWKIQQHLMPLLEAIGRLTAKQRQFLLLTCHSPQIDAAELHAYLADAVFGHCQGGVVAKPLTLATRDDRTLPSGLVAHWPGQQRTL